jgi:hypothetical protein
MPEKAITESERCPPQTATAHERGFSYKQDGKNLLRWNAQDAMTNLLLLPERQETDTRHLYDFEADTGNVTLRLAAATEARDEDLVVVVDKVQAAVVLYNPVTSAHSTRKGTERHAQARTQ